MITSSFRAPLWLALSCSLLLVGAMGCADDRPAAEAWARDWSRATDITAGFHDPEALNSEAQCNEILVQVRVQRPRLVPTPDESLDQTVERWIERAASLGFTCPTLEGDRMGQARRLDELFELESEIEGALEFIAKRAQEDDAASSGPG